ncbi:Alanine racemase [hydrothermal vent metagenome]|uniref:Alanine racemase n=1 Tax=hydrothermal vent metagenome TaxID=652676 RepID=A0A3B1DDT5_9ZZZZ
MPNMHRGPVVEINLDNLSYNLDLIKGRVIDRAIFPVVKADAYGHGAVEISRKLIHCGINSLAVAYISEAIELRKSGINNPVIVLFDPGISGDILKYGLVPVINCMETAKALSALAVKQKKEIGVHVNVDTGMGRLGFNSEDVKRELTRIASLEGIRVTGLMSHFSDAGLADRPLAEGQVKRFSEIRAYLQEKGIKPVCHIANSAAVMTLPESYLDAVRPGLLLYGCNPYSSVKVKPLMSIKTRLLAVRKVKKGMSVSYGRTFITMRDSLVGVLPVGYADGFIRAASNNAEVIVRGKRAPVIGRVCMDLTMVDLTDVEGVKESDEVVIVGSQGEEFISVEELASRAGTIAYEVFTSIGLRNRRVYTGSN